MKVTERIQQRLQHTSGSKHGFLEPHGQVCLHEFSKLQLSSELLQIFSSGLSSFQECQRYPL